MAWLAIFAFLLGWYLTTVPNRRYLAQLNAASKAATEIEALLSGIRNVNAVSVTPRLEKVFVECEVETYDDREALRRLICARYGPPLQIGFRCKVTDPFSRQKLP